MEPQRAGGNPTRASSPMQKSSASVEEKKAEAEAVYFS